MIVLTTTQIKDYTRHEIQWRSKNRHTYFLSEMDTGHIQNCIITLTEKIQRCNDLNIGVFQINGLTAGQWIEIFKSELAYRDII